MKSVFALLAALALSSSAYAQQLDLASMTCESFVKADKDQVKVVVAWLNGYYTEDDSPEVVSLSALNSFQDKLMSFCSREGSFTIEAAAQGILGH
jgi:acid stress chaperone HdeB